MGLKRGQKNMSGVKGYAKRSPGKHSMGDGLELHVSPKGKAVWRLRSSTATKDTVSKLGEASAFQNEAWTRARINEIRQDNTVSESSLGRAVLD